MILMGAEPTYWPSGQGPPGDHPDDGAMRVFALVGLLWLMLGGTAWADTIVPTTLLDPPGAGSCPADPCSLRQAVNRTATDRIELEAATYALTQSAELPIG